jgi:acyl-coenzyme A thioesterase PaaI-like protein
MEAVLDRRENERLASMLKRIPYAQFLGMRAERAGDEMTAILPFSPHLIGNPVLPALHGGVLGAFMELTALAQAVIAQEARGDGVARQPGRPIDTFARAHILRMGRRIANVRVEAWQDAKAAPIAALYGRFLLDSAS